MFECAGSAPSRSASPNTNALGHAFAAEPDRVTMASCNCDHTIADAPEGLAQTWVERYIAPDVSHQADRRKDEDREACNSAECIQLCIAGHKCARAPAEIPGAGSGRAAVIHQGHEGHSYHHHSIINNITQNEAQKKAVEFAKRFYL